MYKPYSIIFRDNNPKRSATSGVSIYPLTLARTSLPIVSPPPFNPASLSAPLITWFGKQDVDIGYTAGNPTSWVNQGTNGGTATLVQCGSATQNGLKGINFKLANSSYGEFYQNFTGQPRAIFIACNITTDLPNAIAPFILFSEQGTATINGYFGPSILSLNPPTRSWALALFAQGITAPILSTDETYYDPTNVNSVFSMVNSAIPGNNIIQINGTTQTLALDDPANSYYTGNIVSYLNGYSGVNYNTYILYEMLVYDGEVSSTDATKVTNYLRNKWAI